MTLMKKDAITEMPRERSIPAMLSDAISPVDGVVLDVLDRDVEVGQPIQ
jgi:hypothetical protein